MDGREEGVGVQAGAAVVDVDVGVDVIASPKALCKAEDLGRGICAASACLAERLGKSGALSESTLGRGQGEEGGAVDLLPEIEAGLVPVADGVAKILLDDGPDNVESLGLVAVGNQPVCVDGERGGAERWSITLGAAPSTCEGGAVYIKLGLSKTTRVWASGGVRDSLKVGLSRNVVIDLLTQGCVARDEAFNECLICEGSIACPGVPVFDMSVSWKCQYIYKHPQSGSVREGLATTIPAETPGALLPPPPMLARMPLTETVVWVLMKASMVV